MKPLKKWFFLFVVSLGFVPLAHALDPVTVWYQPTPYPTQEVINSRDIDKTDPEVSIPHIMDRTAGEWPGYSLVAGSWNGEPIQSYIQFGLDGLPKNVTSARLHLLQMPQQFNENPRDDFALTPTIFNVVNDFWSTDMGWSGEPDVSFMSIQPEPVYDQWYVTDITVAYEDWKKWENGEGGKPNYGLRISPFFPWIARTMDSFLGSYYSTSGESPALELTFVPTLELKMPLDNLHKWRVETEIGGGGCQIVHGGHQGNGYFSIDFSGRGISPEADPYDTDVALTYLDPTVVDVPILAAADGEVKDARYSTTAGNYVEIGHGTTGITTRYYHMKALPLVHVGDPVIQGQVLGYMGNTPTSANMGVHLDFNVQYYGSGKKEEEPLTRIIMEGKLLKSYQVDNCPNGGDEASMLYFTSSNVKNCGNLPEC